MTGVEIIGNRQLAARARALAADAAPGSLDRQAYGCAAVALSTTRSVQAAREALASVYPPEAGTAARARLSELASASEPRPGGVS